MWPDQENLPPSRPIPGPAATAILSKRRSERTAGECAETVRSPPNPGRHGEETVQPTNASGRRRKPKWDETGGHRFESCRGYYLATADRRRAALPGGWPASS